MDKTVIVLGTDSSIVENWIIHYVKNWRDQEKLRTHRLDNFNARLEGSFIVFDSEADKLEFILTYG